MIDEVIDRCTLNRGLELSCRAPSVHNTQPWSWWVADHSVQLHAYLQRWQPTTDPDGRELVVNYGAALHHLVVALATAGVRTSVHRTPDSDEPDHLATVEVSHGRGCDEGVAGAAALEHRGSDRRPSREWPAPSTIMEALRDAAEERGVLPRVRGPHETLVPQVRWYVWPRRPKAGARSRGS